MTSSSTRIVQAKRGRIWSFDELFEALPVACYNAGMSEADESRRRFQVTLRGILWAQFWLAICMGSVLFARQNNGPPDDLLNLAVVSGITLSPFIAGGALFGRPLGGLIVGVIVICVCMVALIPWLRL